MAPTEGEANTVIMNTRDNEIRANFFEPGMQLFDTMEAPLSNRIEIETVTEHVHLETAGQAVLLYLMREKFAGYTSAER
jgi:hypothetical protein